MFHMGTHKHTGTQVPIRARPVLADKRYTQEHMAEADFIIFLLKTNLPVHTHRQFKTS